MVSCGRLIAITLAWRVSEMMDVSGHVDWRSWDGATRDWHGSDSRDSACLARGISSHLIDVSCTARGTGTRHGAAAEVKARQVRGKDLVGDADVPSSSWIWVWI